MKTIFVIATKPRKKFIFDEREYFSYDEALKTITELTKHTPKEYYIFELKTKSKPNFGIDLITV